VAGHRPAGRSALWSATKRASVRPPPQGRPTEGGFRPSLTEARDPGRRAADASKDEIQAAYARLIRLAHPDKGGTAGLAAQLNAARDRLLKR
jgi:hypothetical protein